MQRDSQENARRLYQAAVAQSGYFTSGQARQAGYAYSQQLPSILDRVFKGEL